MAAIVVNTGREVTLNYVVGADSTTEGLTLHYYVNAASVGAALTIGALTECTEAGYSSLALTTNNWTTVGGTTTYGTQQTTTFSGSPGTQTVYGYYYTLTTGGTLFAVEELASPFDVRNNGDNINVTPEIDMT